VRRHARTTPSNFFLCVLETRLRSVLRKERRGRERVYIHFRPGPPRLRISSGRSYYLFLVSGAHSDVVQVFQDTQDINARSLVFRLVRRREASRPFVPALILLEELRHADMLIKQ
jgi:hypothetical protein